MPIKGYPNKTIVHPPKKAAVAFALCLWKKNVVVRRNPITHASPLRNNI